VAIKTINQTNKQTHLPTLTRSDVR